MEEKKYIDRLYQEKFKEFEAAPRRDLWKNISAELKKEEKKTPLIPLLWTRIAGVAAILTLILLLGEWLTQPLQPNLVNNDEEVLGDPTPEEVSVAATSDLKDSQNNGSTGNTDLKEQPKRNSRDNIVLSGVSSLRAIGLKEQKPVIEKRKPLTPEKSRDKNSSGKNRSILEAMGHSIVDEEISIVSTPSKIEISTHAAPIYYGNLRTGNFIDSKFNNNSSEGEITYSYGINVAYSLSEKLKIRSGISKVSMSYNTNDIAFQAVVTPRSIQSINYRSNPVKTILEDHAIWTSGSGPQANYVKTSLANFNQGLLNQKLGFIEVPVELEYLIVDQKIAVNIIGGASTLFLDENSISISSGNIATVLGEANNLNNVSFSTNIGLGFDYNVSEKLKVNLEPMFKYQINTFNAAPAGSHPFYIGVYSGLSYKF